MKKMKSVTMGMVAATILTMSVCSCSSNDDVPQTTAELTIDAVKGEYSEAVAQTRTLTESGSNINFSWTASDKAFVYTNDWGTKLGELTPMDGKTGEAKTKLDGTVSSQGVSVGDQLMLITPRETWDYTGQVGTLTSISSSYDYSTASAQVLYIDAEHNNKIYATDAHFTSEQAIVKFVLKDKNDADLSVPSLTIIAGNNKLVQKCKLDGTATEYGPIVVTPASNSNTFYVALRNDNAGADTYTLSVSTASDVYTYTKSDVTFAKGKFKTITVKMKNLNDTSTDRTGYDNEGNETWE